MKSKVIMILVVALAALSLVACSSGSKGAIADGAKQMRTELAELKKAVDAGDAANIKKYAEETDEAWEKFEDAVKEKDKDAYAKIEDPLHAITAAAKEATPNQKLLQEQIAKLDALLAELK